MARKMTTLKITDEEAATLDSIASELGVTRSEVLRCATVPELAREVADLVSARAGLARAEAYAMIYSVPPLETVYLGDVDGVGVTHG